MKEHGLTVVTSHDLEASKNTFNTEPRSTKFDSTLGISGVGQWLDGVDGFLYSAVKKGLLTSEEVEIYSQGITLGYPDRAIEDFANWDKTGRKEELIEADILSVHPLAQRFGSRITPEFDYLKSSMNDPEIVENIQNSRRILQGVYETPSIKEIVTRF